MSDNQHQGHMSLGDHLDELRNLLIRCFVVLGICIVVSAVFYEDIFDLLKRPVIQAFEDAQKDPEDIKLYGGFMDTMMIIFKGVFMSALVISLPYFISQFYRFVKPGLYTHEIRFLVPLSVFGMTFFLSGAALAYFYVAPIGMTFLLKLNESYGVESLITIRDSLDLVVTLMLAFGLAFQTPLIIMALIRSDIVSAQTLRRSRRYLLLAAVILGAMFTPPDPWSQIVMAASLIVLFELGLLLGEYGFGLKKQNQDATDNGDSQQKDS